MDLTNLPLLPPPAGKVSNYIDPETRAPLVIGLCVTCIVLLWVTYSWRLVTKAFIAKSLWWDDLTVTIAVIGATGFAATTIWTQNFFGPHSWDIRLLAIPSDYERISLGGTLLNYGLTAFFTKLSLFLLYLRIFRPSRWLKNCAHVGIILCFLVYFGTTIAYAAACVKRPNETWIEDQLSNRCLRDTTPIGYVQGIFGLVSDMYLYVLPIPVILKLHMTMRKKVGILLIFATALLAPICSAVGLYYRVEENVNINEDPAWNLGLTATVAVIEVTIGIIVCSVPYLPPSLKLSNLAQMTSSFKSLLSRVRFRSTKHYSSDSSLDGSGSEKYRETQRSVGVKSREGHVATAMNKARTYQPLPDHSITEQPDLIYAPGGAGQQSNREAYDMHA